MNWCLLYTKPKSEKSVAEKLKLMGFDVFCPLLKRRKQWSDRKQWVEEPLFPSYCFVKVYNSDRSMTFGVKGVLRYVFHCGKPATIREEEIEILERWFQEYNHESIEAISFQANEQIIIKSGALFDKKAKVIQKKGHYLKLLLKDIGLQVKVDLRKNIIQKIK